ncbi:hypothetical protein C0995_011874 [Termitomyces sp. Mi166|nr:hypothetical protein C0995_011874 [Termitomyces sp. Mi166\
MSTVQATKRARSLLQRYLQELAANPLRTKAITTGTLCFLQEVLGSTIAGAPVKRPAKGASPILHILAALNINVKALKMAIYGFLVSAPMSHYLTGTLQKAFAGKTSTGARIGQIVANSLLISPVTSSVYLASMAIINGAKTFDDVIKTVKAGLFSVLRVSWVVSPLTLAIAQKYIPLEVRTGFALPEILWVPFFNSVQFVLGTYFNVRVKQQLRIAAAKKAAQEKKDEEKQE